MRTEEMTINLHLFIPAQRKNQQQIFHATNAKSLAACCSGTKLLNAIGDLVEPQIRVSKYISPFTKAANKVSLKLWQTRHCEKRLIQWMTKRRWLSALNYHYESQCIPTPAAWYLHQLPDWFQHLSVVATYVIEIPIPFLFFSPVRSQRLFAFFSQVSEFSHIQTNKEN